VRYYFNVQDGSTSLDDHGTECDGIGGARSEAFKCSMEILPSLNHESLWSGEAWKLWVTDQPNGAGATLFTMTFTASA
jgi:hypothetical protein